VFGTFYMKQMLPFRFTARAMISLANFLLRLRLNAAQRINEGTVYGASPAARTVSAVPVIPGDVVLAEFVSS
jgi:hypothetical protein